MDITNRPEFNSSLTYLERLNILITTTIDAQSTYIIDKSIENLEQWVLSLDLLFIELEPRLTKQEIIKYEEMIKTKSYMSLRNIKRYLNTLAHKKGLIMKDKASNLDATEA